MILIIDTSQNECQVGLYDGKIIDRLSWQWEKDTGGEVINRIEKLLGKKKKKLSGLKTILVDQGPGSYTGVRVGIVVANTISWVLNIPAIGLGANEFKRLSPETIEKITKRKHSPGDFPTPIYS